MNVKSAKAVLTAAAGKVAADLKARHFARRGLKFVHDSADGEFVSLIEFQLSRSSTSAQLSFVINFGVIVPSLFGGSDISKPEYTSCHWGGRVSGKDGVESWWSVHAADDVDQLTVRLNSVLEAEVLPALATMQREEDLIALWKTGRGPGLGEAQRLLFLATLLHRAGRRREFEETRAELEGKARDSFGLNALRKLNELREPNDA